MNSYRLYFMDRFSGHIDNHREFVADDDDRALEIADAWFNGSPMELWTGTRKLRHWDATPIAPLSSAAATSAGG
jgi:hypothetical protein